MGNCYLCRMIWEDSRKGKIMKPDKYEIDMCNGPLAGKMLMFSIPLMFSGILQLLFNTADIIVVGRVAGTQALAAVGSTSTLIFLLTSFSMGMSVGISILIGRYYGAGREDKITAVVHTASALGLLFGCLMAVLGIFCARQLLVLMGTPEDILEMAVLYMRIYFAGMPAGLFYNFGASILRAVGDTKRPLYFLSLAGSMNVALNVIFTVGMRWEIAGVALATVFSQAISAALVFSVLYRRQDSLRLYPGKIKLHKEQVKNIMRIGCPASLQSILFSFSNVLIQSSINSFGSSAMAGSAAAANIEGFVTTSMNAFHQTAMNFTSQNFGAGKYQRIRKVLGLALVFDAVIGIVLGNMAFCFGEQLLGIYTEEGQAVSYGMIRLVYTCVPYFLLGTTDIFVGCMRGLGRVALPMIVSLAGVCGLRVLWIYTIFRYNRTLDVLYMSYPATWAITALMQMLCTIYVMSRMKRDKNVTGNIQK